MNKHSDRCVLIKKPPNIPFGFTLIEVLVALFIFTIAAAMTFLAFNQFIKNRSVLNQKAMEIVSLNTSMTRLSQDLSQIVIWPLNIGLQDNGGFFTQKNTLTFSRMGYINPNWAFKRSSLQKLTYVLEPTGIRRMAYDDKGNLKYQTPLIKNVSNIHWTFIDNENHSYDHWPPVSQWRNLLPAAITIEFDHPELGHIERYFFIQSDDLGAPSEDQSAQ